jgi:hypothetical protein
MGITPQEARHPYGNSRLAASIGRLILVEIAQILYDMHIRYEYGHGGGLAPVSPDEHPVDFVPQRVMRIPAHTRRKKAAAS